jgi:subtilisin family serine protease
MDPISGSFNISGVAPEATLYMYKAVPACTYNGGGGSDILMAAFEKAAADGVDLISMSVGLGSAFAAAASDPLLSTIQAITSQGIAVITALGNDVHCLSAECSDLYTAEMPAIDPTVIGVGAIANSEFPIVYSAVDSAGASIKYASVYPLNFPNGADVFILGDCTSDSFISAISAITNINETILVFPSSIDVGTCYAADLGGQSYPWSGATATPVNILGYNLPSTNPFGTAYDVPSPGFFGSTTYININAADGTTLTKNYNSAGGYTKYKLFFKNTASVSIPQSSGGMVDYYSDYGPAVNTWEMKPQISAPAGHVLSTWPLVGGGYAVLSGTSMATPYVAGAYALVKSQFPHATIDQILALLQTNAKPVQWIYDTTITSTTVQQGAGLINVYDAIFAQTTLSPGQLLISDNSPTVFGAANITIHNGSPASKTYTLSHQGAGYTDWQLGHFENTQLAQYGTAKFTSPTVVVPAGSSKTVLFSVIPPSGVNQQNIPVFAGFIEVSSNDGEVQHVPYSGPAYSLYNAEYFVFLAGGVSPSLSGTDASGNSVSDTGFLEVDASLGWSMSASTLQWTTELLVYVLPGNTKITADNYGLNTTTPPAYQPSRFAPNNTVFGFPSFGTMLNKTAFTPDFPGAIQFGDASVFQSDTVVTSSNGVSFSVGNGDYRFFYAILRWYGTSGVQKDYETYLSPVVRFVNGTS